MAILFSIPGKPQGKARPRFTKNGHTFTPHQTAEYEQKIRQEFARQAPPDFQPFTGPVRAWVLALFPVPSSYSRKRREALAGTPYTHKPDADNIAKAVLDALNGCAYTDDSQIQELAVIKKYAPACVDPSVRVLIEERLEK